MKILNPNLIRKSVLLFVLLGIFSCGKDDAPTTPEDPCNTTPLLTLTAKAEGLSITATATGGKAPYTFQLDNGTFKSSGSFTGLSAKEYTVTVQDANDCIDFTKVTVADPCAAANLTVEATTDLYTITASASGGTAPYTYILTNSEGSTEQESTIFESLDPGTYTLEVKDSKNCSDITEVILADPCSALAVEVTAELYAITAVASGGVEPYMYSLNGIDFQDTGIFADLPAQDYTVTLKDANECTTTAQVTAVQLASFTDDRDGQTYKVVKIGDQIWTAENLNYQGEGVAYSCPNNDAANCDIYGALYTWNEAQLVVPEGWHVATNDDWNALIAALGGSDVAGAELKVDGSSGFDALYAGSVMDPPGFNTVIDFEYASLFWGSTSGGNSAFVYYLNSEFNNITSSDFFDKVSIRLSVRCVKD
ncbi:FISUMP domain-containing protein [Allomuricauda sp. NBRC 101325]|uniref:FISUMP domain-containing protein n=1 Tax=Allomuricauda sp. NBRC 101325 TaxID=1113758 RepID=UPI0024A3DCA1|nr:FISUMP domain-containing protein [Muricauda sp. NBRC 101325]GLU43132.1 hypothetical protein Musp01_07560 [Muricauda sp. NBRC 101325]